MSLKIGKSKSKSDTQQQSTSTNTLDPTLSNALYSNVQRATDAANSLQPFTGQRVAGFNDTQLAAQQAQVNLANSNVGGGLLNAAGTAATNAAAYQPSTVTAASYAPTSAAPGAAVSASTATAAPDVTTGPISSDQINAYLNPYTNDVVTTTNADLDRQRQIEQLDNAAAATKANAFGGTGAAVLSSLTNDNYARQTATADANLMQSGYNTALSAAQTDAARKLQADLANQSATNQIGQFNAGQQQSADVFNSGQSQNLNLANAGAANQAAQFNAGQDLAAQTANQNAGLTANGQAITAGGLLGTLSNEQQQQAITNVGLLGQVGDAQQAEQQKQLDAALQAWQDGENVTVQQQQMINQALGLLPVTGTTTNQGTSSGSQTNTSVNASKTF
jgi:hypothetical protein